MMIKSDDPEFSAEVKQLAKDVFDAHMQGFANNMDLAVLDRIDPIGAGVVVGYSIGAIIRTMLAKGRTVEQIRTEIMP